MDNANSSWLRLQSRQTSEARKFAKGYTEYSCMVSIEPLRIEIERENDGRILASVPDLPGVMAYGDTEAAAVRKVKSIALQVLADMVESGDDVPEPLKALFAA